MEPIIIPIEIHIKLDIRQNERFKEKIFDSQPKIKKRKYTRHTTPLEKTIKKFGRPRKTGLGTIRGKDGEEKL